MKKRSKLTLIPIELARMMIKAYDKERGSYANKKLKKEFGKDAVDSRSVWISKEAILKLMEINKADGVRLYFALADDFPNYKLKRQEYKKRHTLIMVATQSKNPDNPTMENSVDCLNIPPIPDRKKDVRKKTGPVLMPMTGSGAGLPADDLDMCPPPVSSPGALLM